MLLQTFNLYNFQKRPHETWLEIWTQSHPEVEDPIEKLRNEFKEEIGKLNKENDSSKIEMAKLKEKSANEEKQ